MELTMPRDIWEWADCIYNILIVSKLRKSKSVNRQNKALPGKSMKAPNCQLPTHQIKKKKSYGSREEAYTPVRQTIRAELMHRAVPCRKCKWGDANECQIGAQKYYTK